jgi:RNA polymerase sigma-70 factor (ECF subfamily)
VSDRPFGIELVDRIRGGDPGAAEELIERYSRAVTMVLHRAVRNRAEAEDLFQETFRIAIEKIRAGDVRQPERISGFICGLANNLIIEHFRRGARRNMEAVDAATTASPAPGQLDKILREERARIARRVLNELPLERDRQILHRFYIAEESKAAICADSELSSLQFDQILFRARQRYKVLYDKVLRKK